MNVCLSSGGMSRRSGYRFDDKDMRQCKEASTTLADLLTPLLVANPFSAMRASLRR